MIWYIQYSCFSIPQVWPRYLQTAFNTNMSSLSLWGGGRIQNRTIKIHIAHTAPNLCKGSGLKNLKKVKTYICQALYIHVSYNIHWCYTTGNKNMAFRITFMLISLDCEGESYVICKRTWGTYNQHSKWWKWCTEGNSIRYLCMICHASVLLAQRS